MKVIRWDGKPIRIHKRRAGIKKPGRSLTHPTKKRTFSGEVVDR